MEQITSRSNSLVAHIRKLGADRKYRREQGQFLAEGPKLLEECAKWGGKAAVLVCAEGFALPFAFTAERIVTVPADVFKSLSTVDTPQGALAVCAAPDLTPPEELPGTRFLVLDGVQDPGNLGTVWRTADAFGCDGLLLANGCADPLSPKTVRATMGACFRLPAWETSPDALKALLDAARIPLYATALREDTVDVRHLAWDRAAVVIGSEGRGISQKMLEISAQTVKIPMRPRCESLNAAVAASVVLWEMFRGEREQS